ncbi:MAG TPA: hypothetical protein VMH39_11360, partial [Gemmatimonadaceae bacterium]|nr:hypothetical protein [Gemmatimonadaceae bacterium]
MRVALTPPTCRAARRRRLSAIGVATLATMIVIPRHRATVPGVRYTEHHVTISTGIGAAAGIAAPHNEYAEGVEVASGRVRRELLAGLATAAYPRGDYELGDHDNGLVVVDPNARAVTSVYEAEPLAPTSAIPADVGDDSARSSDIAVSLDTLEAGGVIDGQPTRRYRVNVRVTVRPGDAPVGCRSRGSKFPPPRPQPTMKAEITTDYWLAPVAGVSTRTRELLDVAGPWPTIGPVAPALSALLDPVRSRIVRRQTLARLEAVEIGIPEDRVALKSVTATVVTLTATGERATTVDNMEISDITDVDIDASRLVLPDGFAAVSSAGETRAAHTPDVVAPWRALPVMHALAAVAPSGQAGRFAISPPIGGKGFWDLAADGELNLGAPGRWTISPQTNFTATTLIWGAGGGASRAGNGAGGGGGFSTGTISFQAGTSYTLIVGAGGAAAVAGEGECGGDGGFGGGGAGGSVDS